MFCDTLQAGDHGIQHGVIFDASRQFNRKTKSPAEFNRLVEQIGLCQSLAGVSGIDREPQGRIVMPRPTFKVNAKPQSYPP